MTLFKALLIRFEVTIQGEKPDDHVLAGRAQYIFVGLVTKRILWWLKKVQLSSFFVHDLP